MPTSVFSPNTLSGNLKVACGQHLTVTASDTVATGLTKILYAVSSLESDPVATAESATAVIGNQTGTPAAGSILIKSWMPTATANTAPAAASTFGKKVNWIAVGY